MSIRELREAVEAGDDDFLGSDGWIDGWDTVAPELQTYRHKSDGASASVIAVRAYRGSLDAAKRLHDALLPGWPVRVMDHSQDYLGGHGWHACVNWHHMSAPHGKAAYPANSYSYTGWNDNPARAWLIAILRALEEEERDG